MKTPTLIVRLLGLFLLAKCAFTLFQIHQAMVNPLSGLMNQSQYRMVAGFQFLGWLGLAIGLAAVAFAGPMARILTFDADPKEKSFDLSDQLLGQK